LGGYAEEQLRVIERHNVYVHHTGRNTFDGILVVDPSLQHTIGNNGLKRMYNSDRPELLIVCGGTDEEDLSIEKKIKQLFLAQRREAFRKLVNRREGMDSMPNCLYEYPHKNSPTVHLNRSLEFNIEGPSKDDHFGTKATYSPSSFKRRKSRTKTS
jgi:hypothetical protein